MIDVNKLRGVIAERNVTQGEVAEHLGISRQTFSTKMKQGVFSSAEMSDMIAFLKIENPTSIFFAECVSR